ncbi:hypothetical protein ACCD09_31065, partial [Variovorax sp. Varisp62]
MSLDPLHALQAANRAVLPVASDAFGTLLVAGATGALGAELLRRLAVVVQPRRVEGDDGRVGRGERPLRDRLGRAQVGLDAAQPVADRLAGSPRTTYAPNPPVPPAT